MVTCFGSSTLAVGSSVAPSWPESRSSMGADELASSSPLSFAGAGFASSRSVAVRPPGVSSLLAAGSSSVEALVEAIAPGPVALLAALAAFAFSTSVILTRRKSLNW